MVPSENVTRDGPQRSHLMELSMELHICIRDHLLTDPDSTLMGLRPLRLVCKTFNDIWSPVVVTNMVLFPTCAIDDILPQLRHIVHGKLNASTLACYTSLTIQNLRYVDTKPDRWYSDARRVREQGMIAVLKWMDEMLSVTMTLFFKLVFYLILATFALLLPLIRDIINLVVGLPVGAVRHIKRAIPKFRARYYMVLVPRKLNMHNIRRVRLLLDYNSSDWVIYRSTRILLSLPHLTELELGFSATTDMEYLFRCLEPLKGLHKLTLLSLRIGPSHLRCIAAFISNNENLTHFDWRPNISPDFSALFGGISTNKPLKLHHLSWSHGCTNPHALMPHIRSLTSIEFRCRESNRWCISFSQAKIFPPIIKVELLDRELVTFIMGHPGLVSLTIGSSTRMQGIEERDSSLCKALTHHSETLQYLFFKSRILVSMLRNVENETNFLLSTGNLRELVLETDEILERYLNPIYSVYNEWRILRVVAQLSHSLTVTIKTGDKAIFFTCVAFCRYAENPLIRDLAGRIVYERVRG